MKAKATENAPIIVARRPAKRRLKRRVRMALLGTPLALVSVGAGVIGARLLEQKGGVAPQGVFVGKTDLGGKSEEEIKSVLTKIAATQQSREVVLRLPETSKTPREWKSPAQEIGLGVDVAGTMSAALKSGDTGLWDRIKNAFVAATPQHIPLKTTVDANKLRTRLKRIAKSTNVAPKNARLIPDTEPFTVLPGRNGSGLDVDAAVATITTAWNSFASLSDTQPPGELEVELPAKTLAPEVTEEALKQVDGELGRFRTHFGGTGANRGSNISLAAGKINGTLLAPGGIFSYNETVGPRIASAGFKDAPVIIKGELVPGIGGGICQVSTTLYNAVLLSNLKIVTRSHHAFPVHYVPAGRDATVVDGAIDFKFQNDTRAPVYIHAIATGGSLEFRILGRRAEGRSVAIELADHTTQPAGVVTRNDPSLPLGKRVVKDRGHTGHRVNVYRVVRENGAVVNRELIARDSYRPFPAIILVGSGKPLAPAPTLPLTPDPKPIAPTNFGQEPPE